MADPMKLIGIFQPATVGSGVRGQSGETQPRAERESDRQPDSRTRAAIERLDRFLASGVAPRQDVPRGTYLNITI